MRGGCHRRSTASFRAVESGVAVIDAFRRAGPRAFEWRAPPYEYEHTKMPIDILYGSAGLREGLEHGMRADALIRGWADQLPGFLEIREKFLVY
jgi:uncharacterized protein YbbC (DUF1343 family)